MCKSTRKVTQSKPSDGKGRGDAANASTARGSVELSTRDLYCIQTIYDQQDVFKLLVSEEISVTLVL